jgi:methyltransferase family protein
MAESWRRRLGRLRRRLGGRSAAPAAKRTDPTPAPNQEEVGQRRLAAFRRILGALPPGRLLDLGAGHGAFSLIGQELGWDVTAVDARTDRMPMSDGIRWIQADARTFDVSGYDCIAILGLLYHLGLDDQRDLLRRCAGTPTILDTHHALRAVVTVDGYEGRMFAEPGETEQELARVPTASWGNPESFWPTRRSLVRLLTEAGYETVLVLEPPIIRNRTFYLCL